MENETEKKSLGILGGIAVAIYSGSILVLPPLICLCCIKYLAQ